MDSVRHAASPILSESRPMGEVGHNNPPTMIQVCDSVAEDISGWLAEHPVIDSEADAKEAKLHLDRGKLSLKDMEDERDKAVRPLNEQVKAINEAYRPTKIILSRIIEEIRNRLTTFLEAEERKRIEAAREAARIAAEAERKAREAIAAEEDAFESASTGELGLDAKAAVVEADNAIRDAERAARAAQIAEKETQVKVTGGFSRAASLRSVTTYHIEDAKAALHAIGLTDDIEAAILKGAREYHKEWGEPPPGIVVRQERKI